MDLVTLWIITFTHCSQDLQAQDQIQLCGKKIVLIMVWIILQIVGLNEELGPTMAKGRCNFLEIGLTNEIYTNVDNLHNFLLDLML